MSRKAFFTWLAAAFGVARAQAPAGTPGIVTTREHVLKPRLFIEERELEWFSGKARNNQCPVCGTLAPAFHRTSTTRIGDQVLTRCLRCNAGFWQDSEVVK